MTEPLLSTLVLGGARSGKSRYAERLALESGLKPVYVATGWAGDDEMAERIAEHRARRGGRWCTVEEPLDLVGALEAHADPSAVVLVDCLTLWLSNLMHAEAARQPDDLDAVFQRLTTCLAALGAPIILVSNEVGLGLVPETPLGRAFRDAQGRLNQAVAHAVPRVVFIAAGLPLVLKGPARGGGG